MHFHQIRLKGYLLQTFNTLTTSSTLGSSSLDEEDITILDNVVLSFGHNLPLCAHAGFVALFLQHAVVVHNHLDECLLKVTVDDTSRLRSLGAVPYRPLANLVCAGGEEAAEVELLAHRRDDLRQCGASAKLLALFGGFGIGLKTGEALLEGYGDGDHWVRRLRVRRVFFDPSGDGREMLVFLADVVLLGEVDEKDNGLGGKEEEWVDDFDLF